MSRHVLVVDLGWLTVSNCFNTVDNDDNARTSDGLPAIIDHMSVNLTDMKLSTYVTIQLQYFVSLGVMILARSVYILMPLSAKSP